jgi:flavin-dependent dehydrogenase
MTEHKTYDAIVLGGGPAGATAATALAQRGRRVVLLERQERSRYHVGESLLPFCYDVLDRIGVLPKVREFGFTRKLSVQFISAEGKPSRPFYFDSHLKHARATTWQVVRSEFDQLMLDHARDQGVEVHNGVTATDPIMDGDQTVGILATDELGHTKVVHAPMTIDATGRDGFFMRKNGWRQGEPELNRLAVWTYVEGAKRESGRDEGTTIIARLPDDGWIWFLPLHRDQASVGAIARAETLIGRDRSPQAIYDDVVSRNPWIVDRLSTSKQIHPIRITSDYSYRSRECAAHGVILCGDAFAFMDPVFSSGIFLALASGEQAGIAVDRALADGHFEARAFDEYGAWFRDIMEPMRRLIYAFYDPNFSFSSFLKLNPHLGGLVTDCLVGNLTVDFRELYKALDQFTGP